MERVTRGGVNTVQNRTAITPRVLSNNPCEVIITMQVNGGNVEQFTLRNEKSARNLLARMVPVDVIVNNTKELISHIDDDTAPMFDFFREEAITQGLDLPDNFKYIA
jgi:hypothetical protein